jgi:thioredoxin 2
MNSVIVPCASCNRKNRIPADKQHLRPKCGHCQAPLNMAGQAVAVELDDGNFHDFIKSVRLPVMVDFYSPTCGPCQSMVPVVNAMARDFGNRAVVAKVDTSRSRQLAMFFQIRGVPTFMFFKNGSLEDQLSGAYPQQMLEQKLAGLL